MSRKPRLVHQGSPIIDGNESNPYHHDDIINGAASLNDRHQVGLTHQSNPSAALYQAPAPRKFKLQTRLVVGGGNVTTTDTNQTLHSGWPQNHHRQHDIHNNDDEDSLDAMMTDGDEHDIFDTHSSQHQQRQHQSHFSYSQTQQHFQYARDYQSFQQPIKHESVNTQQPSQIYHMPSPSTSPLVVIDGANISYAYAESLNPSLTNHSGQGREPNPRGITLAIQYFLKHQCRVQAVVPISWYKLKPRPGDHFVSGRKFDGNLNHRDDAKMVTEEVEELRTLRQHGFLVPCPPGDDDDAFALALARREEERLSEQHRTIQSAQEKEMMLDDDTTLSCLPMGGYVVSNDFFHDAVRRDERQHKQHHQLEEEHFQQTRASSLSSRQSSYRHSLKAWLKKHRISYSFANVGLEVSGRIELEFLPNPRNELIEAIDAHTRLHQNNH